MYIIIINAKLVCHQSPLMLFPLMFLLVMPSQYDTKSVSTDDVSVDVPVGNAKSV